MTEKRLNQILAAVFLIVGILATWSTFRLHSYINETLPRDRAQEQCNTDTIAVLQGWVDERIKRDDSMNVRDDAVILVLDKLVAGGEPTQHDLDTWREAVAADRQVRLHATSGHLRLPECLR